MKINDSAWERLFDRYRILDAIHTHGKFIISSEQIKEFREPRLMTKFDHRINLPSIFKQNNLAILPITRGDYMISSFLAYKELETSSERFERVSIPSHIQSLMPQFLVSEAIALNCANACGILDDFLEDEALIPTVNGRMGTGEFKFNIDTISGIQTVCVRNSQIEIDAAYEGIQNLSLFEAKKDLADDFLIRQLYYPYRVWKDRVTKPVKTVFFVFSNGVFELYQYNFEDYRNYNSIHLEKQRKYMISTKIYMNDIDDILKNTKECVENNISFPQANDMLKIINLIELLFVEQMTKQDITSKYAFDERQTNYYTDAGRYLELIQKERDANGNILFHLTQKGRYIMKLGYKERLLAIATQILAHRVFRETLKLHLQTGEMPDKSTIVSIMKKSSIYNVEKESTFDRRASTVIRWVEWIIDIVDK